MAGSSLIQAFQALLRGTLLSFCWVGKPLSTPFVGNLRGRCAWVDLASGCDEPLVTRDGGHLSTFWQNTIALASFGVSVSRDTTALRTEESNLPETSRTYGF